MNELQLDDFKTDENAAMESRPLEKIAPRLLEVFAK